MIEQTGWLLLHSFWQFAAMGVLVLMADRILQNCSASVRYVVLLKALLLMAFVPVVTWYLFPTAISNADATASSLQTNNGSPAASAEFTAQFAGDETPAVESNHASGRPLATDSRPVAAGNEQRSANALPWWQTRLQQLLQPWLSTIVGIWCCGVLLFSTRPVCGWLNVRRLQRVGVATVPESVQAALKKLRQRLNIGQRVSVLQSSLVTSPIVVGCFRSTILLPVSFVSGVPASQLETILAHELAHVKRCDYLVNLLQALIETLFFYHPAVWWLSRRIREERENCCDDLVVATLNNKVQYGRALLAVEELRRAGVTASTSSGLVLSSQGGALLNRLMRLFGEPDRNRNRSGAEVAAMGILPAGILAAVAWTSSIAQDNAAGNHPEKATPTYAAVAELTGNLRVELHGVMELPESSDRCWQPDGTRLERPAAWPEFLAVVDQHPTHGFVFRFAGLSPQRSVKWQFPGQWAAPDKTGGSSQLICVSSRCGNVATANLKLGISTEEWGPWQRVESDGTITDRVKPIPLFREIYGDVTAQVVHNELGKRLRTGLKLIGNRSQFDFEAVVVGDDGVRHERTGISAGQRSVTPYFSQKIADINHLEFRLRPYKYQVTFKNVSLQSEQKSNLDVSVDTIPDPPPDAYVARLPNGRTVELVGITMNNRPANEGWKPDGRPLGVDAGEWKPDTLLQEDSARDHLFRLTGFQASPSLWFSIPRREAHYTLRTDEEPWHLRVGGRVGKPKFVGADGTVQVTLSNEPWGKWLQISADSGEVLNPLKNGDAYRSHYETIRINQATHVADSRDSEGAALTLTYPSVLRSRNDFKIRGIDSAGEVCAVRRAGTGGAMPNTITETYRVSRALPDGRTLSRFEVRLRPYRHRVTFENVVTESAADEPSEVKVSVEMLAVEQNGDDTTKPVSDAAPDEPIDRE